MDTFYGFKIGQRQEFDESGNRVPVTLVKVTPITVINNSQVVFGTQKHLNKPFLGMLKNLKEKITPRFIKALTTTKSAGEKIIISDVFNSGDTISVTGASKGAGFAGVVKRHGFAGGPKTHGQSDRQRAPGAISSTTTPGRVWKGKKMPGHMGNIQVTISNLKVFAVKPEENLLLIKGLVPGKSGGLLKICKKS